MTNFSVKGMTVLLVTNDVMCKLSIGLAMTCSYGNCTSVPVIPNIKVIQMTGNKLMLNDKSFLRMDHLEIRLTKNHMLEICK